MQGSGQEGTGHQASGISGGASRGGGIHRQHAPSMGVMEAEGSVVPSRVFVTQAQIERPHFTEHLLSTLDEPRPRVGEGIEVYEYTLTKRIILDATNAEVARAEVPVVQAPEGNPSPGEAPPSPSRGEGAEAERTQISGGVL